MSNHQLKALESYARLADTNGAAHVFRAAMQLGVFDTLRTGQKTAAQIAENCQTALEPTRLLLEALVRIEVLEQYGDDFAVGQVIRLISTPLRDLGDHYWTELAAFVKDGKPLPKRSPQQHDEPSYQAHRVAHQWMMTPAALQATAVLGIGQERTNLQILDLAAGSAIWSLTLAHHDTGSSVTAVDVPDALRLASETAAEIGLQDRLHSLSGDYREVELPAQQFDLTILANVTHFESREGNVRLLRRIFEALKPEGELAIIDIFPGQDKGDLHRTLRSLEIAMRTEDGRVYTANDMKKLLTKTGFLSPVYAHLNAPPHTMGLILAQKPGL